MDINAVQAEASTKATAWLTTNLPTDAQAAPAVDVPEVATPPVTKVDPVAPENTRPGLADKIRSDREARAAAAAAQTEAGKYKSEVETLRKENESLKALGAANDPFDFLRNRKLTKEQQALWGQAFLYDLKPEVAPQEFRLDLYKADQARKAQEQADREEQEAREEAQRVERTNLDRYASELMQHVQAAPGSNPESEAWFSEEGADGSVQVNHRAYAQSLFATANNIATQAQKDGRQADLSPANIARTLEAEVAKRMQRRDAKRAGSAKTETQAKPGIPASNGTQAVNTTTTSAVGLRSGAPIPLEQTDEARRARAAAALFGTK